MATHRKDCWLVWQHVNEWAESDSNIPPKASEIKQTRGTQEKMLECWEVNAWEAVSFDERAKFIPREMQVDRGDGREDGVGRRQLLRRWVGGVQRDRQPEVASGGLWNTLYWEMIYLKEMNENFYLNLS